MRDLSSPTRDSTRTPQHWKATSFFFGRQSLNHWTTREVLWQATFSFCKKLLKMKSRIENRMEKKRKKIEWIPCGEELFGETFVSDGFVCVCVYIHMHLFVYELCLCESWS